MEIETLKKIFNPIDSPKTDIPSLEAVDEQLMKLGTLQHDEIDWDKVFRISLKYLSVTEKNLDMLYALVMSMQMHSPYFTIVCAALYVQFALLFAQKLVEKDKRAKRKLKKIAQSIELKLNQIDAQEISPLDLSLIDGIRTQLEESGIDSSIKDMLSGVMNRTDKKIIFPEAIEAAAAEEQPVGEQFSEKASFASASSPDVPVEKKPKPKNSSDGPEHDIRNAPFLSMSTDFETARKTKQTLLEVASHIAYTAPAAPLSYLLRRFAIWQPIDSLPEIVNGKTQLNQVPRERIEEYETGIKSLEQIDAKLDLLLRIEKSITTCPFWTYGNYLSACCAKKAGMINVAGAIKTSLASFIGRLPGIEQLRFSGGEPFVPEAVESWLNSSPKQTEKNGTSSSEQPTDDPKTLKNISGALLKTSETRLQVLSQINEIEFMAQDGKTPLAAAFLTTLDHRMQGMMLKEWEPSVFKKIENIKKEYEL